MRSRALAILIAVVVPLAALGLVIAQRGDPTHKPARLPILAGGRAENAALGAARADAALYPYGGIVYKAGPNLPALDGAGRAYKIPGVDAGAARRLADALGFNDVAPDGNGTFSKGDEQLSVSPFGYWGYTRLSGEGSVSSSGVAVACAPNADCPVPETTIPQHPADLPTQDVAKATALDLLQRAGIDADQAKTSVDDLVTQWSVHVDPMVDGLPTEGLGSTVTIGENNAIEYASGILGRPEAGDEYPLIGTTVAIDRLNKGEGFIGPRPMMAEADASSGATSGGATTSGSGSGPASGGVSGQEPGSALPTEPKPVLPCETIGAPTTMWCGSPLTEPPLDTIPPPPPQEITLVGAERVLLFAPSFTGDEGWLLPAYRFTTSDGVGPTVLAISDSFLITPDQVPTGKDGTGSDGSAGSVGSDAPVSIEPAPAGPPDTIEPPGK
ncbi:MAG: hypothetical protein QOD38_1058 [Acidimicrobiaceae bacterium]